MKTHQMMKSILWSLGICATSSAVAAPKLIEISELMSHTDAPFTDAFELHNVSGQSVNLKGWWVQDKGPVINRRKGYEIPNDLVLPPDGYISFRLDQQNITKFKLKASGDALFVIDPSGQLQDSIVFPTTHYLKSYGYFTNSIGEKDLVAFERLTMNADYTRNIADGPNSLPYVGEVVFSEVMNHPARGQREFLELTNTSNYVQVLNRNGGGYRIPELRFEFPGTPRLYHNESLIVTLKLNAQDSEDQVREDLNLAGNTQVFFYEGSSLSAVSSLTLQSNETFTPNDSSGMTQDEIDRLSKVRYYYDIEFVRFANQTVWSQKNAHGTGLSLERRDMHSYTNEPNNWQASQQVGGTPGFVP